MGGIHTKESSIVEVHSIRNSQVILRARSSQNGPIPRSLPVSRNGSIRSTASANATKVKPIPPKLHRSLSDSLNRNCSLLKLRNGRCPLMEQSMDILEKIFKFLTTRDLVMLSLTSKALNFVVRTYVNHQCDKMNLRIQFDDFCDRNKNCLLPKELVLQDRLKHNAKPNLLLFSTGNHYLGHVTRVSFLDVDHFAHLSRETVKEEFDVALKRNVVVVRSQRVNLHMVHVFSSVLPGTYTIQFRIRLPESKLAFLYRNTAEGNVPPAKIVVRSVPWATPCNCDGSDQADITPVGDEGNQQRQFFPLPFINIVEPDSAQVAEQLINARSWIRIWEHTHITRYNTCPPSLSNAYLRFDSASDWFFLELKPFKINKFCHLQVEFKAEAEEYRWKKGMYWDFLELRQVPSSH